MLVGKGHHLRQPNHPASSLRFCNIRIRNRTKRSAIWTRIHRKIPHHTQASSSLYLQNNWWQLNTGRSNEEQSHVQQNSRNEKKSSQNQKRRGDDNNKTPVEDPAGSNKSSISVQKNSKNEKQSPQKNRTKNDNNCEEQRSKTTPQQDWSKEQGISRTTNNKTNKDEKKFCRKEFNNTTPVCIYINLSAKRKIRQHSSSHHLPINQFGISISTPASYEIADLSGKFGIIENIPQHKLLCSNHRREDWFIMRSPQIEFQPKKKMQKIRSEIYFTWEAAEIALMPKRMR